MKVQLSKSSLKMNESTDSSYRILIIMLQAFPTVVYQFNNTIFYCYSFAVKWKIIEIFENEDEFMFWENENIL